MNIARAIELISGSAAALEHLAPADSIALKLAAAELRGLVALADRQRRLLTPADKRAAWDKARAWMLRRAETWPTGKNPPSVREDYAAARREIPGIPLKIIKAMRPPEWHRPPGRPRNV